MAQFTIDIDTGGTFTDGFFTQGDSYVTVKVDTTPHDLTVCFNHCIREGASRFGYKEADDFLRQTKMIRFSTTIGTNSLIQKTGPKLGLIVTEGHERSLYQENNPILKFLIDPDLIVGITESVSETGEIEVAPKEEQVRRATKQLLEAGARVFVVSLKNSHLNLSNEKRIREMIRKDFPGHYLGAKTIQLAGEISKRSDDGIRTNASVVNAYLHRDMVKYLYKADEGVRNKGFTNHLLIAHSNGGVARVAKTKAMDTYNSGPVAGLMGSAYIGKLYGIENILTVDVGGTSTDVGVIRDGDLTFDTDSKIAGIPVQAPLIHVLSVGGGGGSIAKVDREGRLQLGPESAGAIPGPACFDLGGLKPTVTDATVVLKWIDPQYFLGGTKQINEEKAYDVINKQIASKLNQSKEEAAFRIVDELTTIGANALKRLTTERGYDMSEFTLFSFGGGGGLFSGEIARKSGIKRVYTFPFSSVFSAFGLSTADVNHVYETRTNINMKSGETDISSAVQELSQDLIKMRDWAYRDMRGEGFQEVSDVRFQLELEGIAENKEDRAVLSVPLNCSPQHINMASLERQLAEHHQTKELRIQFIRLRAWVAVSYYHFPTATLSGAGAEHALKSVRRIYWENEDLEAKIYDINRLKPGNEVRGPAIIENKDTTIMVPPEAFYRVDQYFNGILEV